LRDQCQNARAGSFEWNLLEAGPGRFRVEIRRREAAGPRHVTEYLEADHRRLDEIAAEVRNLAGSGSFPQAAVRFAEFRCGLDRHIEVEEQVLFPLFEQMTGMSGGGPTFVMRGEHVEIRRLMDDAAGALEAADRTRTHAALDGLMDILGSHNMKEERILYPMTDRAAGSEAACDDLVCRLQSF
jgi:iron-sulfur cluster repair protein YtfE (RIC family)